MLSILRKLRDYFSAPFPATPSNDIIEEQVPECVFNQYSGIISNQVSYFNELSFHLKRKFVQRVYNFIRQKEFQYIGLMEKPEIPVLISASAVQVTFGLNNYLLQQFPKIIVLADAYHMDHGEELYIGHVAPEGIYISWKHFLYGYSNNEDNINVGVHEMSHALLYNNFFTGNVIDKTFRLNYEKFSSTTGPILAEVITRKKSYLRSYAFSNLHEFWAVSVEAFFEKPDGLKKNMPDLYEALCNVLNQDPMTRFKILKSELC